MSAVLQFEAINAGTVDRFVPLYVAVFNAPPWNDGWTEAAALERLAAFAAEARFVGLGAWRGGEPVGLVLGNGERWTDRWLFHLREMCVATACQGEGVGRALMARFEDELRRAKYSTVFLQTGHAAPARTFYEAAGFETYGHVPLHKRLTVG